MVTITFGYAATYFAGFLGIMALIHRMTVGVASNHQDGKLIQDILYRMTYAVVCFGLFLSFIGTVLGGLWADDSWGRFWGWDPKENGALMIVLWNAIVLHSRWDKQVGQRGFALLAVVGNIITTWSWFGCESTRCWLAQLWKQQQCADGACSNCGRAPCVHHFQLHSHAD